MNRRIIIATDTGEWMITGGHWWEPAFFDTWREAMDYADQRARTVEVTLPRSAHQNTGHMRTTPSTDGLLIEFFIGGKWETMRVPKHELDPLALALLAQHYSPSTAERE